MNFNGKPLSLDTRALDAAGLVPIDTPEAVKDTPKTVAAILAGGDPVELEALDAKYAVPTSTPSNVTPETATEAPISTPEGFNVKQALGNASTIEEIIDIVKKGQTDGMFFGYPVDKALRVLTEGYGQNFPDSDVQNAVFRFENNTGARDLGPTAKEEWYKKYFASKQPIEDINPAKVAVLDYREEGILKDLETVDWLDGYANLFSQLTKADPAQKLSVEKVRMAVGGLLDSFSGGGLSGPLKEIHLRKFNEALIKLPLSEQQRLRYLSNKKIEEKTKIANFIK